MRRTTYIIINESNVFIMEDETTYNDSEIADTEEDTAEENWDDNEEDGLEEEQDQDEAM